jgi:hypothetical protein
VRSCWEGTTWLTVDDTGSFETRRWMDGDTLFMARAPRRCPAAHSLTCLHIRAFVQTETRKREAEPAVTCKRVFRWVRSAAAAPPQARLTSHSQVASDPIWSGESDDMQVLMKRTVTADEEEYLLAPPEPPPQVVKQVVKARSAPQRRAHSRAACADAATAARSRACPRCPRVRAWCLASLTPLPADGACWKPF